MEDRSILIVGGGLAGLSLAYHLSKNTTNITLVDRGVNHSSRIAAGMINPLVFRRMTKSWRVDEFMPFLHEFYTEIEQITGASFYHPITIRRMFSSQQERTFWVEKQTNPAFSPYMELITAEDDHFSGAKNEFGSGRVKQSSYVNTTIFLDALKAHLQTRIRYLQEVFDPTELKNKRYRSIPFDEVVFCEGYSGVNNPYFNWLPLHQTKGETLRIKSATLPHRESVNRKCFVLPLGKGEFKIGSTYIWNTENTEITEGGRSTLLHNLSYLTDEVVETLQQEAGIRPTTEDRRPLIGTHPELPGIHIFNGLGTKGYMTAPLLAKEFSEYLLLGAPLHPEVQITRFRK